MSDYQFSLTTESLVEQIFIAQLILTVPGILINLLHVYILCHVSLRTSSTNSILIGIGIVDLLVLSVFLHDRIRQFWFPACSEISRQSKWTDDLQRDILKQTSFCPKSGYFIVRLMYLVCFVLSILFYFSEQNSDCTISSNSLEEQLHFLELISASSQILISLIYPILAILLICVIWKSTNTVLFTVSKTSSVERLRYSQKS
ncbi:Protein CBG26960 [Caenorhabditis briggsae]|uniref:Protein CBG26960 n=1 Tax=Caenorhabditis briggsae TaxID=6238 RepID=B6IHV3_CAEBR|nr:Protein CBG26960 [Caenorhabditis briggsae]CAR99483.1 Protein CBG26960 [Caenorhabditis briggsae]